MFKRLLFLLLLILTSIVDIGCCMFCAKPGLVGGCIKCTSETEKDVCKGQECKSFVRECVEANTYVHKFWHKHDQIYYRCIKDGDVALTFDDVPHSEESLVRIMNKLEELKVLATFFVTGKQIDKKNGKLLTKLESLGHTIGFHGFNHKSVLERNSNEEYFEHEIVPTADAANEYVKHGLKRYFRPPYLDVDNSFASFLEEKGYKTIQRNFETHDLKMDNKIQLRVDGVFGNNANYTPVDHSFIVLEHELPTKNDTDQDIEYIVKHGREKGYRFVNMEECVGPELGTPKLPNKPVENIKISKFWKNNKNLVYKCKTPGHVALTVEGTPKDYITLVEFLLAAHEFKIPLTFFVEGELIDSKESDAEEKGKLLNCAEKLGHTIASHTYSRSEVDGQDGFDTFLEYEILKNEQVLNKYLDKGLKKYLRPLYLGGEPWFVKAMGKEGYTIVQANVHSHDDNNQGHSMRISRKINQSLKRGDSSVHSFIILLHELKDTLYALEEIARVGRSKGYKFVNMDECVSGIEIQNSEQKQEEECFRVIRDAQNVQNDKGEEEEEEKVNEKKKSPRVWVRKHPPPEEAVENVFILDQWETNKNIHYKCKNVGDVALTFDDVPKDFDNLYELLEQLHMYSITATFFVTGNLLEGEDGERKGKLLRCAEKLGHTIGSHTYSNANIHEKADDEEFLQKEIVKTERIVNKYLDNGMKKYFRPPFLKTDEAFTNKIAEEFGYLTIQVNLDSSDLKNPDNTGRITRILKRSMTRGNPNENSFITLQHELNGSIDSIGGIHSAAEATGFRFVDMDECVTGKKSPKRPPNEECLYDFVDDDLEILTMITQKSKLRPENTPPIKQTNSKLEIILEAEGSSSTKLLIPLFLAGIFIFVIKAARRLRFAPKKKL